jgi:6-pyruvoyl-tetrahydropterin synthase
VPAVSAVIEIGRGEFCAAHTGLHAEGFEPLHGHTYSVVLRVGGEVDALGMVTDFGPVKAALRQAVAPLRRRTLVAAAGDVQVDTCGGRVRFGRGGRWYDLPGADVALLPVVNTTTEAVAAYLLGQVETTLAGQPGLAWAQLRLAEAPGVAVAVRRELR